MKVFFILFIVKSFQAHVLEELLGYATKRLNFCKTTSTKLLCVHRVLVGLEI